MKCLLAKIKDIQEDSLTEYSFELKDGYRSIILQKTSSEFKAFNNYCPHQGRRLDYAKDQFLLDEERNLICPAHAAAFDLESGECINGPCKGQFLKPVDVILEEENIYAIIEE